MFRNRLCIITLVVASATLLSGCDGLSRPSQTDVRACLVANGGIRIALGVEWDFAAARNYVRYQEVQNPTIKQLEWGTTITSTGGQLETEVHAPSGTKIFPVRVHIAESQEVPRYWVFEDSYRKLRCVKEPGS